MCERMEPARIVAMFALCELPRCFILDTSWVWQVLFILETTTCDWPVLFILGSDLCLTGVGYKLCLTRWICSFWLWIVSHWLFICKGTCFFCPYCHFSVNLQFCNVSVVLRFARRFVYVARFCPCGLTLTWWGCCGLYQPSLPTPFYSVLVPVSVFMGLSTVFHSINYPDNSSLSHSASSLIPA